VYFIGLGWLNTWGSARFLSVADDARHLAEQIVQRAQTVIQAAE
jgi:putative flavoprotein involved in K+ transport